MMAEGAESFAETVLSWSLHDICNENLFKHQVVKNREQAHQPFGEYSYLLLETQEKLHSSMKDMHEAPFGQVISLQESEPYEEIKLYNVETDSWRNIGCGLELYKTRPGDVFVLADAKLDTISDLQKVGRWWSFVLVVEVFTDKKEDGRIHCSFKVRVPRHFEVNDGIETSLFVVFLANLTPNWRIWNAMHMCKISTWKVLFSSNFMKSLKVLEFQKKMSVLNLVLKLSGGWRPKKHNVDITCKRSSMILKQFKADGLYIVLAIDIEKDSRYMQVLKIWDVLPGLLEVQNMADRLDCIFSRYTHGFINLCREKCFDGDREVPASWSLSLDVVRYKDLCSAETPSISVGDLEGVETSKVNESLLLMKFYSLASGAVNFLLSDQKCREVELPFEVTDQERETVLYNKSMFILGRSGTGKTTVVTTKLYRKEHEHCMANEGIYGVEKSTFRPGMKYEVGQSSSCTVTKGTMLHQLFVTVSPKLCFAVRQQFLHLRSFACGENSMVDLDEVDDEEVQFSDIPDSFCDVPPKCYPLFITFHKFLMMLDGSLSKSYFERFVDFTKLPGYKQQRSRAVVLQNFLTSKEVTYDRFSSSYWPHFDVQLRKKLDTARVYTEIISHIKGGLRALEIGDGKLCRSDYVQLSEGRASTLSQAMREKIYDIFQVYEKMKMRNGEFDIADFVNDIHHRLKRERYAGDEINFVYIDEVQDLAMSQIALFKHISSNVEEGFVFSGDTAQTIARGIDFRFQDIQNLFYKMFLLESKSQKQDERREKGQMANIFHLTQNYRSHDGILKLLQSIVELVYRFFPQYIDVLKPETSMINGEAPILLYSEDDEDLFVKILGTSGTIMGGMCGFGADQVILVRDDKIRKKVFDSIGKQSLVLTIMECKGLEFQDVLLYNFFGSSPLKNEWRVLYNFMKEQDLLDSTFVERFPSFDDSKHSMLCSELKHLYVAVSRAKQRLWVYETLDEFSNPIFAYWKKKCLVQVRELDDSLSQAMQVPSTSEDWRSRGIKLYHVRNYKVARMCFERAGDTFWERRSEAADLKVKAELMWTSSPQEANAFLMEAALIFESIGQYVSAARCFYDLHEYEQAGTIYLYKCSELEKAGECFYLAANYVLAAQAYAKGNCFIQCLSSCLQGKLFEKGLEYIKCWRKHSREEYDLARKGDESSEIELEFLESCAFYYYEGENDRSRFQVLKDEMLCTRTALNSHISSSTSKYLWEEKLPGDLKQPSKQISMDSLVYFWNSWKHKVEYLIEYLESIDHNNYMSHGDFFLNYLGVWRHFHDVLNQEYLSLILDTNWVRSIDKRSFRRNEELVSIDVHQFILDAQSYWRSEMFTLGNRVLEKLEMLYNILIYNSDSVLCQSWSLILIFEVAANLMESKCLKLTHCQAETLHKLVKFSTEKCVSYIFPLDWGVSLGEKMISLRRSYSCKNMLNHVIVEYIRSKTKLSSGQFGCIAMIILGSCKLDNEVYDKLAITPDRNYVWMKFIRDLCGNVGSELPEERRNVSLLWRFYDALSETYKESSSLCDDMSPEGFLYLIERLLIWVSSFQGYAITTRSCFVEWLLYQEENAKLTNTMVNDDQKSFKDILKFLAGVIHRFLFNTNFIMKWIKKSTGGTWKKEYSLLIQRVVAGLCMLYLSFGICYDTLLDLLSREYVADHLPYEFRCALEKIAFVQHPLSRHAEVLARAFKNIGNPLVVASFGINCSRFSCSDAIFIDMKTNLCMADMLRSLFSERLIVKTSQTQTHTTEKYLNRNNFPVEFVPLWEIFSGLKLVTKERDEWNLFSDASKIKLDVEKIIRLLAAVWSSLDKKQYFSREVLSMLDILMQLYAALDGREQELANKMATIAEVSRSLRWRMQRFFWSEKVEPIFSKLFLEHNAIVTRKALESVVKSGNNCEAGSGDCKADENHGASPPADATS